MYQTVPTLINKDLQYDASIAYSPRSLTVQVDDTSVRTINLPYDASKAVGEVIELIDRNDYTRMNGVPVRIKKVEKAEDDWKVTLENAVPIRKRDVDYQIIKGSDNIRMLVEDTPMGTVKEVLRYKTVHEVLRNNVVYKQLLKMDPKVVEEINAVPVY